MKSLVYPLMSSEGFFVSFRDIVTSSEYIVSTTAEYGMLWIELDSLRSMCLLKHTADGKNPALIDR